VIIYQFGRYRTRVFLHIKNGPGSDEIVRILKAGGQIEKYTHSINPAVTMRLIQTTFTCDGVAAPQFWHFWAERATS
jgi:hypothetical protein